MRRALRRLKRQRPRRCGERAGSVHRACARPPRRPGRSSPRGASPRWRRCRDDGAPWCSFVMYAALGDGTPVLCLSTLAEHGRNVRHDARASLVVARPTARATRSTAGGSRWRGGSRSRTATSSSGARRLPRGLPGRGRLRPLRRLHALRAAGRARPLGRRLRPHGLRRRRTPTTPPSPIRSPRTPPTPSATSTRTTPTRCWPWPARSPATRTPPRRAACAPTATGWTCRSPPARRSRPRASSSPSRSTQPGGLRAATVELTRRARARVMLYAVTGFAELPARIAALAQRARPARRRAAGRVRLGVRRAARKPPAPAAAGDRARRLAVPLDHHGAPDDALQRPAGGRARALRVARLRPRPRRRDPAAAAGRGPHGGRARARPGGALPLAVRVRRRHRAAAAGDRRLALQLRGVRRRRGARAFDDDRGGRRAARPRPG